MRWAQLINNMSISLQNINPERMLRLFEQVSNAPESQFSSLDWPELLAHIADRCHSEQSKRAALCMALPDDEELSLRRYAELAEVMSLYELTEAPASLVVEERYDAMERAQRGVILDPEELIVIARNLEVFGAVSRFFGAHKEHCPLIYQYVEAMPDLQRTAKKIGAVFAPDGSIVDKASPDLAALREKSRKLSETLRNRIESKLAQNEISTLLQDSYYTQREGRYVLPVKIQNRSKFNGIVHATSASGQTVFVEPADLVELNNTLRMADFAIAAEEGRILQGLSLELGHQSEAIAFCHRRCLYLDLLDAVARFALDCGAHIPLPGSSQIALHNAKHPLLALREKEDARFRAVGNNIYLSSPQSALIISGANAGGKTVCLKTLGLFALMAKAGIPLTVGPDSTFSWYSQIFADIGDEQSLAQNTSTFSARVIALSQAMQHCGPGSIFLLDEPFSGTDPEHASALVIALLECLHQRGVTQCVTTHYDAVKAYAIQEDYVLTASVGFDIARMQATYKLCLGQPGASAAFEIAEKHGLSHDILGRAQEYYAGRSSSQIEAVIQRLEQERVLLEQEREELGTKRVQLEAELRQNAEIREKMRLAEISVLGSDLQEAHERLSKLKERIKAMKKASYRNEVYHDVAVRTELEQEISHTQSALQESEKSLRTLNAAPVESLQPGAVRVGARVYSKSYRNEGQVLEVAGDKITLQMGAFKVFVHPSDIGKPAEEKGIKSEPKRKKMYRVQRNTGEGELSRLIDEATGYVSSPQTSANTLDLRGLTGDEAVERTSWFIESLVLQDKPVAYIIHGHGTGVLKKEVRALLSRMREVVGSRAGTYHEGGDGVTLAFLKK